MATTDTRIQPEQPSMLARSIALMKPVTWFAPTWAFLCGAIATGQTGWTLQDAFIIALGMVMAGPVLCGVSQVINDYFDQDVDAINEPDRVIPSGMVTTRQVTVTILVLMTIGFGIGLYLGRGVSLLVVVGLFAAIAYSAPPIRAKRNGWAGNALVAVSYEGLAWLAGHLAFAALNPYSIIIAALYSLGTHGIMSINDYKGIEGDRASGIHTIPVLYGAERASWMIVATMNIAQVGVMACLFLWGQWIAALAILGFIVVQLPLQRHFLKNPTENYLKFSAFGVTIFVWGMLVAAIGLRALG